MPSPEPISPAQRPWEAIALFAVALGALAFQLVLPRLLPSTRDFEAAAALITREAKAGDVVLLQPWWTEHFRLFAPRGVPVVGYLGSAGDDLSDAPRIWVVSQPRLPFSGRAAFDQRFGGNRDAIGAARRFGPLSVELYANGRWTPASFRASEALASASVSLVSSAGERPCTPEPGDRFRCANGGTVEAGWHELRFVPHRCIALQAPGGSTRLVLTFPNVPETRGLLLEAGIVWEHAAKHDPGITPLNVTLEGGEPGGPPLAVLNVPPGVEGMQRAAIAGVGGTLSLSIQSDRSEARYACLELRATGRGGAR